MELMKDKRGVMELLYNEIIKLIIVAILGATLFYFIYSSANGELERLSTRSKGDALLIDAALNSGPNAETELKLQKDILGTGDEFEIIFDKEKGKYTIKNPKSSVEREYRVIQNSNKKLSEKEEASSLVINVA